MNANLTATAPLATDDAGRQVALIEDGKQQCSCSEGCPGRTTRFFSQGHDARLVTRLRNAVVAGEISTAEAFAEITKRGGTERLQIKLDAAVANARSPKKAAKASKKAPLVTFEIDGFRLREDAHATEVGVWGKVGRWEYQGDVTWHRIVEEGATAADTIGVFRYEGKDGEPRVTTKWTNVTHLHEAEVPAEEEAEVWAARAEAEVLYSSEELDAEIEAQFAAHEAAEAEAEDLSDIPF